MLKERDTFVSVARFEDLQGKGLHNRSSKRQNAGAIPLRRQSLRP